MNMKTRNNRIWTNGIHGEIKDIDGIWKKFQVTSSMVYNSNNSNHELTEECKRCLRDKYDTFWDKQEYDI